MKVSIDNAKCDGYGVCSQHLPEVFKLDEWGYAYIESGGVIPPDRIEDARQAASSCPAQAIRCDDAAQSA